MNHEQDKDKYDFSKVPAPFPSMCIPRLPSTITKEYIYQIFTELQLGEIDYIDLIERKMTHETYKQAFVHMKRWFPNKQANFARQRLLAGLDVNCMHDEPWFWKICKYKTIR